MSAATGLDRTDVRRASMTALRVAGFRCTAGGAWTRDGVRASVTEDWIALRDERGRTTGAPRGAGSEPAPRRSGRTAEGASGRAAGRAGSAEGDASGLRPGPWTRLRAGRAGVVDACDLPVASILARAAHTGADATDAADDGDDHDDSARLLGQVLAWVLGPRTPERDGVAADAPADLFAARAADPAFPPSLLPDDADLALRAGTHLERVRVERTDRGVVLRVPLAVRSADLPAGRASAIDALLADAAIVRLVRIADDGSASVDATVDLSGAPPPALPGLADAGLAALRFSFTWLAPTLRVLTDPSVRIAALDA